MFNDSSNGQVRNQLKGAKKKLCVVRETARSQHRKDDRKKVGTGTGYRQEG